MHLNTDILKHKIKAQLFKKGDIVRLKSGGPKMTVEKYHVDIIGLGELRESDSNVICKWFDNENKLVQSGFEQETLVKDEE